MLFLRFRAENHRSLRDEAELSLVHPWLKTTLPPDGDWNSATTRVAGIYGANASGKSTVVDALKFMRHLVAHSATTLASRRSLPQRPFLLDREYKSHPSTYSLDFVHSGTRYQYGFQITTSKITQEWLYDYPRTKHRVLFEREEQEFRFGRSLIGAPRRHANATGARELFISKAASNGHTLLADLQNAFSAGITITDFTENDRNWRLNKITDGIAAGDVDLVDVLTLLRVADIGIADVDIDESEIPEEFRELTEIIRRHFAKKDAERRNRKGDRGTAAEERREIVLSGSSEERESVQRALKFRHFGHDDDVYLPLEAQSTGTLSWLSLALPALDALREGGVIVVDELDASLHPQLSHVIMRMFKDADYNRTGAQLIFTTHDTFLLSPQSDAQLSPEEIWFTEKNPDGVTELFPLTDFATRPDQNFARRYLDGRYGGVPRTARSFLASLLDAGTQESVNA